MLMSSKAGPRLSRKAIVDFQYVRTLGSAPYGGSTFGELAAGAALVRQRGESRRMFIATWIGVGRALARAADQARADGLLPTARSKYLRAYNYLRMAEFFFFPQQRESHARLYAESVACFARAMELTSYHTEQIEIPFGDITMPGWFMSADDSGTPRRCIVIVGGGDGHGEELYLIAGVPEALARGFHVLLFHGPGQRGLLHRHPEQVFRPDWEVPMGAVLDYAEQRPDVDAGRIGGYGLSFGGHLVPRAAVHDPRLAAIAAFPPIPAVTQLGEAVRDELPPGLGWLASALVTGAGRPALLRAVQLATRLSWPVAGMVENYIFWAQGVRNLAEYLDGVGRFTIAGDEDKITAPVLAICSEGEGKVAEGLTREFAERVGGPADVVAFRHRDGIDAHCAVDNVPRAAATVYDWFDRQLR